MKRVLVLVFSMAVLASACGGGDATSQATATPTPDYTPFATAEPPETVEVTFDVGTVTAEVASTGEQRALGLMHRRSLGTDDGMLFVFPAPDSSGFWMKNTLIPLQIAYMRGVDGDTFDVVALRDMVPCEADPCEVYEPGTSYDAALEVNQGWFDDHGVRVGSRADVEGDLPTPR